MFRKRKGQDMMLPTSSNAAPSAFHFPGKSNGAADGSGAAIRMEAPIAKAWKTSSIHTKITYYATLGCLFSAYFGYRWLRWSHASVHLICHTQECTFSITPKGWQGHHSVTFPREQLVRAEAMKVDNEGSFVALSPRLDDFDDVPGKGKNKHKKKTTSYKGPDKRGHYPSYRIVLKEFTKMPDHHSSVKQGGDGAAPEEELSNEIEDVRLTSLENWMTRGEEFTMGLILRQHGIFQSRRRVKTTVQKIDSYIKRRRHKLTVKENTAPSWQGILFLVLGIFGLLLTLLIGQFWEPEPPRRKPISAPGTRARMSTPDYKGKRPSVASAGRRNKAY